jgi:two-component system sensor histidine kinase UhpB
MLETAGLEATLRWLAEQYQQHTRIATQVEGHLNGVPGDLAIACFRIVQEALTNIVRHARARHVSIELCQGENVLELVILDDGVGFDVERTFEQAAGSGRLGLLGMRERVQIIGGSLEVHSQPDRGTRIRVSVPLAEAAVSAERGE